MKLRRWSKLLLPSNIPRYMSLRVQLRQRTVPSTTHRSINSKSFLQALTRVHRRIHNRTKLRFSIHIHAQPRRKRMHHLFLFGHQIQTRNIRNQILYSTNILRSQQEGSLHFCQIGRLEQGPPRDWIRRQAHLSFSHVCIEQEYGSRGVQAASVSIQYRVLSWVCNQVA